MSYNLTPFETMNHFSKVKVLMNQYNFYKLESTLLSYTSNIQKFYE